jgi:hypothetical protein
LSKLALPTTIPHAERAGTDAGGGGGYTMAASDPASSARRWRRVAAGAVAGLLLLAGAIALGWVSSDKRHGPAASVTDVPADSGNDVSKVLDALNSMIGGGAATDAGAATPTTVVPVPSDSSKDSSGGLVFQNAPAPAGSAPAPGPVGVLQGAAAASAAAMGMRVCTPKDGTELVRDGGFGFGGQACC